jgi:hypothetical protein
VLEQRVAFRKRDLLAAATFLLPFLNTWDFPQRIDAALAAPQGL